MYFKLRKLKNSAKVFPDSAEKDTDYLFDIFFGMVMGGEDNGRRKGKNE